MTVLPPAMRQVPLPFPASRTVQAPYILSRITKWWEAGESFGLATVTRTCRSAPRDPGAALAVSAAGDDEVVGSVSGGCVEGAVYELSLDVCQTGAPVLQTYGVSDDDAFAVGLTCGGIIDIFVERVDGTSFPELGEIAVAVERGASGTLGTARLDAAVDDDVRGMLAQGLTGIRRYGEHGERRGDDLSVFVNSFAPPPRMLVFGAIDFAAGVARAGKFLGYHVTVCDSRKVFSGHKRSPGRSLRTGPLLTERGEAQQVHAGPVVNLDEDHQYAVARPAADDRAGPPQVDRKLGDLVGGAAASADAGGIGHLGAEDLVQQAADGVTVDCFHQVPPVAPNRSVFTRSGG